MRHHILWMIWLGALCGLTGPVGAQTPLSAARCGDERLLRDLKTRHWPELYRQRDVEGLRALLHDDFRLIDGAGKTSTKQQELDWLANNAWTEQDFRYEITSIVCVGNTAVIVGEGSTLPADDRTGQVRSIYTSSNVLVRTGGAWQVLASHISGERSERQGAPATEGKGADSPIPTARSSLSLLERALESQRAGNYSGAREMATQALQLAQAANRPDEAAAARLRLASIEIGARNLQATLEHGSAAEAYFIQAGDPVRLAQAVNLGAIANDELGRRKQAFQGYRTYLELMRQHGSAEQLAWAEHNLGYFLWQKGDLADAERHVRAGLEHFLSSGQSSGISALGRALAVILRSKGDYGGANRESARALAAARQGGSEESMLMAFDKRISALAFAGRSHEAAELIAEGEALAGNGWSRGHGDFALGRIRHYLAEGRLDIAAALSDESVARFEAEGYRLNLAHALVLQAQAMKLLNETSAARTVAQRAQTIAAELDTAEPMLQAQCLLAVLDRDAGNTDAGDRALRNVRLEGQRRRIAVKLPGPASSPAVSCSDEASLRERFAPAA